MFGREPRAGSHRQHMPQPFSKGYGLEKVGGALRKEANAFDELMDFLGDSFSGEPSEADVKEYLQFETDYPNPNVGSVSNLAEELENYFGYDLSEYRTSSAVRTASREATASHHLAFFNGFDIPEPRHRVAGWDWDDHLNGFIAAEAAREFTCACGANVPAPGYTDCHCGRRWNAYTIQSSGGQKMIAREVPVRDGVVMAGRTASRKTADVNWYDQNGRQEAHFAGGEHITVFPDGKWEVSTGAFLDSGQAPSVEQAKAESLEALSYLAFGSRKQASGMFQWRHNTTTHGETWDDISNTKDKVNFSVDYYYDQEFSWGVEPGGYTWNIYDHNVGQVANSEETEGIPPYSSFEEAEASLEAWVNANGYLTAS